MEKRSGNPALTFIRISIGPFVIIIAATAFFFAYNTYLIDHSLESLKFSLNKVSTAQTIEDTRNLKILLGEALIKEVSAEKLDTTNIVNLEFGQNIISEAKINDQLKDIKVILTNVVKEKEAKRSPVLLKLDALNENVRTAWLKTQVRMREKERKFEEVKDLTLLDRARSFESNWQIEEAIADYNAFIREHPDYKDIGWIKLRLGYSYLKSGDIKKAEAVFSEISKGYLGYDEALVARGFLVKVKEIKKSIREKEVLTDKAKTAKTSEEKQKIYYRIGVVDTYNFNLSSAREFFKKAIEADPASLLAQKAQFNIGWSLKFQNDLEKSALVFDDVIKSYAKGDIVLNAKYQLADTYHKSGKYEEAIAIYKRIAQDYKDKPIAPLAQFQVGYSYIYNIQPPDPVQASEAFKTLTTDFKSSALANYASLDLVPTLESRLRDFAFSLLSEGKYDKAKEAFMKAVEVNKNDAWAHSGLGECFVLLGDFKQGLPGVETGARLLADDYTLAALAFSLEMAGRIDEAMEGYKKIIARNKDYLVAHYNLGRLYEMRAQYDEAITEFKETIRIDPQFPYGHANLAHAYWFKGETMLCIEEYEKALEAMPNFAEVHYNLGLIFKVLDRKEEAKEEFEETLKIAPNFKEAKEELERLQ